MRFNITNRTVDIKKPYRDNKKYKVFSCRYRRKDEDKRKGLGFYCNFQIIWDISKDKNINENLINKNFILLCDHSEQCLKNNLQNLPEINELINEKKDFEIKVYKFLDKLTFYNKKYVKDELIKIYKDNNYKFKIDNNDLNRIINLFKKNSIKFTKEIIFSNNKTKDNQFFLRKYEYLLILLMN